jgi:transcriptional regulator of acetoin/glycerol metabolism
VGIIRQKDLLYQPDPPNLGADSYLIRAGYEALFIRLAPDAVVQYNPSASDRLQMLHFIRHYSRLYHKSMSGIDLDVMAMLQAYSWPGNVRELEHVIQSAIILGLGERILLEDLPLSIQEENVNVVGIDIPILPALSSDNSSNTKSDSP